MRERPTTSPSSGHCRTGLRPGLSRKPMARGDSAKTGPPLFKPAGRRVPTRENPIDGHAVSQERGTGVFGRTDGQIKRKKAASGTGFLSFFFYCFFWFCVCLCFLPNGLSRAHPWSGGLQRMTFFVFYFVLFLFVTEACIKCKYQDCVEVWPVDCFYEGEEDNAGHIKSR